jgi:hypothetical protein
MSTGAPCILDIYVYHFKKSKIKCAYTYKQSIGMVKNLDENLLYFELKKCVTKICIFRSYTHPQICYVLAAAQNIT